jgi:hypothetical protein
MRGLSNQKECEIYASRISLPLVLFIFISSPASHQGAGQGTTIIKLDGGILWAHNEDGAYFTV